MPTCLIVPEAMREVPERYVDVLHEAGFDIVYPKNPELARNRGGEEELIAELEGVDATIAGSEGYTPKVLDAATSLRVIARRRSWLRWREHSSRHAAQHTCDDHAHR